MGEKMEKKRKMKKKKKNEKHITIQLKKQKKRRRNSNIFVVSVNFRTCLGPGFIFPFREMPDSAYRAAALEVSPPKREHQVNRIKRGSGVYC